MDSGTNSKNVFDNKVAHNYLKALMAKGATFEMFFNVDKDGFQTMRIKTIGIAPFDYQLSYNGLIWIMDYLINGVNDDSEVKPEEPFNTEGETLDAVQKSMFKTFVENNWGVVEQCSPYKDKNGRHRLFINFNNGLIQFFFTPDAEIDEFMKAHSLVVEE